MVRLPFSSRLGVGLEWNAPPMARKNDGAEAQSAFFNAMRKRPGVVIERFWDQSDLRGLNGGRAVNDYSKPADFLATQNAQIEYAEVKSVQSATSFPFSTIERTRKRVVEGKRWT